MFPRIEIYWADMGGVYVEIWMWKGAASSESSDKD